MRVPTTTSSGPVGMLERPTDSVDHSHTAWTNPWGPNTGRYIWLNLHISRVGILLTALGCGSGYATHSAAGRDPDRERLS